MSDSGSDNESARSESPMDKPPSPRSPPHRSPSNSPGSEKSHGSDNESVRSESPMDKPPSPGSPPHRSRSNSPGSKKSRSRSGSRSRSRSTSKSRSRSHSRSRSKSRSRSRSSPNLGSKSRSQSRSKSRSRSRSKSKSRSRSRSKSPNLGSKSRSHSRSKSKSRSRSKSKSRSKSRSKSPNLGSKSRSHSRSKSKSRSRSRSKSPNLEIDEQASPKSDKGEDKDTKEITTVKIKKGIIDSDSDSADEIPTDKGVSAAAIFGDDADDISDDSDNEQEKEEEEEQARRSRSRSKSRSRSRSRSKSRSRSRSRSKSKDRQSGDDEDRRVGEDEGKENEPEPIPETRIDVEVPKITCDLGRDLNFVKLPNFLSVETRPFDPETYEDEIDEEETLDEEGRARLKLKVENTIRWRDVVDSEGNTKKESNARFVRWSDGSYSLHLGSEIFDVYRQPLQGDHNHLFIRQGTGLQGQAVFRTKLSFRPHSTESFTHRKMTLSLADRSQKTSGIKILSQVGVDPDNDRAERLKKEEEKLRQTAKPKAPRKKSDSAVRTHAARDSFREEEGSDDDAAISINAIKNKYKGGGANAAAAAAAKAPIYSSDEDDSDLDSRKVRKTDRARAALKDSDEESDGSD